MPTSSKNVCAGGAVVVIWSAEGAKSEWVRSEADRARVERKLVQMTVDGAALPMPFDQIQCADLAGWQGDPAAAGWKRVVASVAELLGGPTPTRESGQPRNTPPPPAPPDTFSVAVAPFTDPTGATAGDDFADGLVAEISTALARFPALRVMDAGPASGARYLLDGASAPGRINDARAAQGEAVWAERFDSASRTRLPCRKT
ncbi:MAG: hypothetical protein IPF84_14350 [Proteobacteria bacterium]|nr:hypothetical protein [Pseudomonadota bacterium]